LASHHKAWSAKLKPSGGAGNVIDWRNDRVSIAPTQFRGRRRAEYVVKHKGRASPGQILPPTKSGPVPSSRTRKFLQGEHNRETVTPLVNQRRPGSLTSSRWWPRRSCTSCTCRCGRG